MERNLLDERDPIERDREDQDNLLGDDDLIVAPDANIDESDNGLDLNDGRT
jgi:hypothetical protein